jgi:hypothetical protein
MAREKRKKYSTTNAGWVLAFGFRPRFFGAGWGKYPSHLSLASF